MYYSSHLQIKDKAWRRAGESPAASTSFVVSQHRRAPFLKQLKCETTNDKQSGDPMYAA